MSKGTNSRFLIGTSNIVVPGKREDFPGDYRNHSRLHYYSSLFNSLEVNSSFYKVPMQATFEKWAKDVPDDFRFTIKLWKDLTHCKHLQFDLEKIAFFMNAALGIAEKKGCLLIQFPGKISLEDFNGVEKLLQHLSEYDEQGWSKVVEFRNPSWYSGETFELLDEHNASVVLHDIPKARNMELNRKAPVVYYRFHGPTGNYRGAYTDVFLQEKATQIKAWLHSGKDVYAYFNNTMGDAFQNAISLQQMLRT